MQCTLRSEVKTRPRETANMKVFLVLAIAIVFVTMTTAKPIVEVQVFHSEVDPDSKFSVLFMCERTNAIVYIVIIIIKMILIITY